MGASPLKGTVGPRRGSGNRISGRLNSASPHCVLMAAAGLSIFLVYSSYSLVPFLSGSQHGSPRQLGSSDRTQPHRKGLRALQHIESLFPLEVASMMQRSSSEDQLGDHIAAEALSNELARLVNKRRKELAVSSEDPMPNDIPAEDLSTVDAHRQLEKAAAEGEDPKLLESLSKVLKPDPNDPFRVVQRMERQTKRMQQLMEDYKAGEQEDERGTQVSGIGVLKQVVEAGQETVATDQQASSLETTRPIQQKIMQLQKQLGINATNSSADSRTMSSLFREGQDQMVRLIKDQLIMARAYAAIALQSGNSRLAKDLKGRIKDSLKSLGDAETDTDLASNAVDKMRSMGQTLAKAKEKHFECTGVVKKLRAMVHAMEDQNAGLRRQGLFLSQVAARTVPKGLFCMAMRLTIEYWALQPEQQVLPRKERLTDRSLHHYALFSDNVLATAVVVNSTITNCKNSSEHVIHIVTDKLNFGAMKAWFILQPPKDAAVEVMNIDDFKWLNSSYCPVLRQLESAAMKDFYYKIQSSGEGNSAMSTDASANLKYRNPKYLNMLNHLRFYLPEVFPALDKILFLDDDIVVHKDLSQLWKEDMHGMVNGAVETCGASFHRFDKYLNFSNPLIASSFDPQACGWAYGMNMFDLVQWKKKDITGIYHKWQNLNEERTLWKLGTLPPGLITFYNLTHSLPKQWHFLGLGYNPNLDMEELERAAVVHYNGNMKPWLEISMSKFKGYWSKYVDYSSVYLQQCNINP